jgi:hypothetical protein
MLPLVSTLLFLTSLTSACISQDQPNPIGAQYPTTPTGTVNGSILVLPIPLEKARSIIPSNISILEHAYRDLLPDFPRDMYPLLFSALHDHNIGLFGINYTIPDFSVRSHPPAHPTT